MGGKNCKIVLCLESKGLDFCYQCNDYPDNCQMFSFMYKDNLKRGENLIRNLSEIKQGKVEEWLREEERKWRCPECGKPTAMWGLKECYHCGKPLPEKHW
jgi:hypothetical protein